MYYAVESGKIIIRHEEEAWVRERAAERLLKGTATEIEIVATIDVLGVTKEVISVSKS